MPHNGQNKAEGPLPNGLDEGEDHQTAADEFEDGADENADETTPSRTEGGSDILSVNLTMQSDCQQFEEDGTDQRAENNAYGAKEKSDKDAEGATPHAILRSAKLLGAPSRHRIVEYGNNERDDAPYKQELPGEIHPIGGLRDPQAGIGNRRARKSGHYTSDYTYYNQDKRYDQ